MADGSSRHLAAHRRGRGIAIALFAAIVTTFTAVCTVEIIRQAWETQPAPPNVGCRDGIRDLIQAVHRARSAAANGTGGERDAVARFRASLEPEWSIRPGLAAVCAADEVASQALGDVDRLRYAEEHALRYEALDVAARRRRVDAIERELGETR